MLRLLEQISTPTTLQLSGTVESLHFLSLVDPVLRGSHACVFFDSRHAADVCCGSVQPRTNVRFASTRQQLLLHVQLRIRPTLRHIYSHGGNVGNECADHAEALGALGFVSSRNVNTRWSHPCCNTTFFVRGCNDFIEIQHRLCDARSEHTTADSCLAVTLWTVALAFLLCLKVGSKGPCASALSSCH